jgi:hypothetical protein
MSHARRTPAGRRAPRSGVKIDVSTSRHRRRTSGETSDGAVMFLPAEAVFAEIHAYHPDLVEHAQKKRVATSPTTLMAVPEHRARGIRDWKPGRRTSSRTNLVSWAGDFAPDERTRSSPATRAATRTGEVRPATRSAASSRSMGRARASGHRARLLDSGTDCELVFSWPARIPERHPFHSGLRHSRCPPPILRHDA